MTIVRTKVVAYATVIEEMLPLLPQDMAYEVLDFGLLRIPEKLRSKLQEAIDVASATAGTIIRGYGLCAMAVVGPKSDRLHVGGAARRCLSLHSGPSSRLRPG
jgi:hypothetical protein